MPTYEASRTTVAGPDAVWRAWTNVPEWSASESIESAEIDGDFVPGAVITSKAKGFPASKLKITRVDRPGIWTDESRSPGVRMTFDHVIKSKDGQTTLSERVVIRGALSRVVGPLLRRKLEALFAESVAHVARIAEKDARV